MPSSTHETMAKGQGVMSEIVDCCDAAKTLRLLKELIDKLGIEQAFAEVQIELEEFAEESTPYSARLELAIAIAWKTRAGEA